MLSCRSGACLSALHADDAWQRQLSGERPPAPGEGGSGLVPKQGVAPHSVGTPERSSDSSGATEMTESMRAAKSI
jgi:hypothetical protein